MECKEINYDSLLEIIKEEKSSFLCGNGFSINFDSNYTLSALAKRLWETHCHIKDRYNYDNNSNGEYGRTFKENIKQVRKILKKVKTEKDFENMFSSAIDFANSLMNSQQALSWLEENNYNNRLEIGLERIDIVSSIVGQAKQKGAMLVNYEYWSVLIYYILALQEAPERVYSLDRSNFFVNIVLIGSTRVLSDNSADCIIINVACNGMYTYLRFLFTSNILLDGKSYNVMELENWNKS